MKQTIYPKLPKKFKEKWIAALRSKKFKQGTGVLKDVDVNDKITHCCLGVAKEIVGAKTIQSQCFIGKSCLKVPKALRGQNLLTEKLSNMNDGNGERKKGFAAIAIWIEKNL